MKRIEVAVIGSGNWGKNYVRVLHDHPAWHLKYVHDAQRTSFSELRQRFVDATFVDDMEVLANDASLQAVIIATPAVTHYDIAKKFMLLGKHVLVEKPLCTRSSDAKELVAIAAEKKVTLMVGFIMLFIPSIVKAREFVASKEFGRPLSIYARRTNLGGVRHDVNVSWDLAPHDLSCFLWLLGNKPRSVSAIGSRGLGGAIEDTVFVTLLYDDGLIGNIHLSWTDPRKQRETVVVGTGMRISVDDTNPAFPLQVTKHTLPSLAQGLDFGEFQRQIAAGDTIIPYLAPSEPLKNQCGHFAECIREASPCRASGVLGLEVVQLLEAIDKSIHSGGQAVAL